MKKFIILLSSLIVGLIGGGGYVWYDSLPETEELVLGEELFFSYNNHELHKVELSGASGELSVHFLELGNKYTGDCTYIKVGDIDVLIDCGSRTNSVATVSAYLDQYVTDKLDYVIVTHAHQDHYAGFATGTKTKGIFDLYEVGTIIDFGNATSNSSSAMFNRYVTKRQAEIDAGAEYYSAYDCFYEINGAPKEIVLDATNDITLEILYNYYYQYDYNNHDTTVQYKAPSENDYSVCCMVSQGTDKNFLFTGDLEKDGEEKLVDYYKNVSPSPLPQMNLYKAGHHGSGTSSSDGLLEMINPDVVCVCCCAGSSEYTPNINNQFPTQAFITRISKYTDKVFVTTLCVDYENDEYTSMNGNIVIIALPNENVLGINCSNNETILKDSEWFNKIITDENGDERPNRVWG